MDLMSELLIADLLSALCSGNCQIIEMLILTLQSKQLTLETSQQVDTHISNTPLNVIFECLLMVYCSRWPDQQSY